MNTPDTVIPPLEAVLKARALAESAAGVAADRGKTFRLDHQAEHFRSELQQIAEHFPSNRWLSERANQLPSVLSWNLFDEIALGCGEIVSQFKHVMGSSQAQQAEGALA